MEFIPKSLTLGLQLESPGTWVSYGNKSPLRAVQLSAVDLESPPQSELPVVSLLLSVRSASSCPAPDKGCLDHLSRGSPGVLLSFRDEGLRTA